MEKKKVLSLFQKNGILIALCLGAIGLLLLGVRGNTNRTAEPSAIDAALSRENAYAEALTARLVALCNGISGVSDSEVVLTFESGFVFEYASSSQPRSMKYPRPAGAAVVCRGGDVPQMEKEIVDLLSSVLGISSNQIAVSGK